MIHFTPEGAGIVKAKTKGLISLTDSNGGGYNRKRCQWSSIFFSRCVSMPKSRSIASLSPQDRPREKIITKGACALSDAELMAILLGQGTRDQDVLSLADRLVAVMDDKGLEVSWKELTALKGVGRAKAAIILAALEFTRRRIKPGGIKVNSPADIYPHIRHYADRKQECLISISMNGAHEVLNIRLVSMGLVNTTQVHPREVFADPLMDRATSVIVAHNHPSGDLTPSGQDKAVTHQLIAAGETLGITLLDHLIFNPKTYVSLKESGAF